MTLNSIEIDSAQNGRATQRSHIVSAHDDAAGGAATRDLLERDRIGERVQARASERLRHAHAHQPQFAHLADLDATNHIMPTNKMCVVDSPFQVGPRILSDRKMLM